MNELHRRREQSDIHVAAGERPRRVLQRLDILRERPPVHRDARHCRSTGAERVEKLGIRDAVLLHGDADRIESIAGSDQRTLPLASG